MDIELPDSWLLLRRFGSGFLMYLREVRSEILTDSRHVVRSIRVTRDAVGTDVRESLARIKGLHTIFSASGPSRASSSRRRFC